jgi:hypothetical protein
MQCGVEYGIYHTAYVIGVGGENGDTGEIRPIDFQSSLKNDQNSFTYRAPPIGETLIRTGSRV